MGTKSSLFDEFLIPFEQDIYMAQKLKQELTQKINLLQQL
jgi:hypothetical protein